MHELSLYGGLVGVKVSVNWLEWILCMHLLWPFDTVHGLVYLLAIRLKIPLSSPSRSLMEWCS